MVEPQLVQVVEPELHVSVELWGAHHTQKLLHVVRVLPGGDHRIPWCLSPHCVVAILLVEAPKEPWASSPGFASAFRGGS